MSCSVSLPSFSFINFLAFSRWFGTVKFNQVDQAYYKRLYGAKYKDLLYMYLPKYSSCGLTDIIVHWWPVGGSIPTPGHERTMAVLRLGKHKKLTNRIFNQQNNRVEFQNNNGMPLGVQMINDVIT